MFTLRFDERRARRGTSRRRERLVRLGREDPHIRVLGDALGLASLTLSPQSLSPPYAPTVQLAKTLFFHVVWGLCVGTSLSGRVPPRLVDVVQVRRVLLFALGALGVQIAAASPFLPATKSSHSQHTRSCDSRVCSVFVHSRRASPPRSPAAGASRMVAASLAAGLYTGLATFLDAAAFATVVFVPAGLPFDVGIQHALFGFVLMQATVCATSGAGNMVTPVSYEVMPFLAKLASLVAASGAKARAQILPTVLAGSMLVSAAAAVICALLARLLPAKFEVESLLPPPLQAGLFSAIGWGLYTLSYETLGLEGMPFDPSIATWGTARLWLPAHVLGIGLWLASRRTSSPALFPGFVVSVTVLCVCALNSHPHCSCAARMHAHAYNTHARAAPHTPHRPHRPHAAMDILSHAGFSFLCACPCRPSFVLR